MANLSIIRELSIKKNISLKALSDKLEISEHGLQRIMRTNSTKIETLEKISKVLDVPVSIFFGEKKKYFTQMSVFLYSPLVSIAIDQHEKISDKLNLLKDYYIWEIFNIYKNRQIPIYPFIYPGGPESLMNNESDIQLISLASIKKQPPFSKMDSSLRESLLACEYLFDGFYFPIFILNLFSINDYLSDGLIKDPEMLRYWKKWNSIKFTIIKLNWIITNFPKQL